MRVVRIKGPDGIAYGQLVDGAVELLSAPPFDGWKPTGRRVDIGQAELLAPVAPSKVVGVGRNYLGHIQEMGYEVPSRPSVFLKPPTTVVGPFADVRLPPTWVSDDVQHEAELAVVIGTLMRNVPATRALRHVFGYTCANDVSARDVQRRDSSPIRAKGCDTFCPTGPWIETELDLQAGVGVRCHVGSELRQNGHTEQLVFDVPSLLSELSTIMTCCPATWS